MSLYIVSTPIGNLSDISKRAIDTLKEVDLILCEDTRITRKLLERYQIKSSLMSFHHHSGRGKINRLIKRLSLGEKIALVTDSGTPGVSDPGGKLVEEIRKSGKEIDVLSIPGPSAVTAALSLSGFYSNRFVFMGFPPLKKKRKKFFEEALSYPYPVIFYESPHRIIKSLREISEMEKGREAVICREITKLHEKTYRGSLEEILEKLEKEDLKGEFTVVLKER